MIYLARYINNSCTSPKCPAVDEYKLIMIPAGVSNFQTSCRISNVGHLAFHKEYPRPSWIRYRTYFAATSKIFLYIEQKHNFLPLT